jgi:hypothetical protein
LSKLKTCKKCEIEKPLTGFELVKNGGGNGFSRRGVCKRCRRGGEPELPPEATPRFFRALDSKRYIVTSAQNNTFVHPEFFETLKVAAQHLGAELVVIPYRYKNPTGMNPGRDLRAGVSCYAAFKGGRCFLDKGHEGPHKVDELWWDPAVEPFLHNVRKKLNDNLVLAADVKIQATGSSPLTGFESLTGAESCIIGHPKMQYRTVPVPTGRYPKILTTTGACTQRNYSNTKAGALGEFHHFLGALVVEIQGKTFHLRQINADRKDGSFIDLDTSYTVNGPSDAPPALGLIMGDTHVRVSDPEVDEATFGRWTWDPERGDYVPVPNSGPFSMVETLNPKTLVFHDVFDGETVNPHDSDDPFIAEAKRKTGRQVVREELQQVVNFVNARARGRDVVIVNSNHHDFLRRWMVKTNWKQDLKNAAFYLETALALLQSAKMGPGGAEHADPFEYWMKKLGSKSNIRCLKADESFKLGDNECGSHGDDGPNGARGTLKNMARLGVKMIVGHSHTPGIEEGAYQVGTSSYRRLAYQRGPGSHLNTHCVVYANGKRALLSVIGGRFRA